ncbi:MAG: hypothetical protein FWG90_04260 [Oscillospiraceae bacterium]|nr:hypothetical protein [Oscillospiraceae bacterium]
MPELIHINTPVQPRPAFDLSGRAHQSEQQAALSDKILDMGDTTKVQKSHDRTEQMLEENLRDKQGLPRLETLVSKNPAMAALLLRSLAGGDALQTLREGAGAELLNKAAEFAGEVLLKPDELLADILRQESEATIFSGKLWDELRGILSGLLSNNAQNGANLQGLGKEAFLDAVLDFMKAASGANSRDDVLQSISMGLRYLANEAASSRELSENLHAAANDLNKETFFELKNTILSLLSHTEKSLILNDQTKNLIPLIIYNMSRFNKSDTALGESFHALLNMADSAEQAAKLKSAFINYVENSDLPSEVKLAALKQSDSVSAQMSMTLLTDRLAASVRHQAGTISAEELSRLMGKVDASKGSESIREALSPLINQGMGGALNTLLRNFDNTKDLNSLIERLGLIVNSIDDNENKIILAQKLNEILGEMTKSEGISYRPPTSLENMFDFLIKNMDDPALKSLSAMSKSEMVGGLISAPGVYTPLLHFLLPIDLGGFKAFGELWADPDAESRDGGTYNRCCHMFLCFDVENTGYFELEVFTHDNSMNVLLLCPPGVEKRLSPLKEMLPVIAESNGYNISNAAIGALTKRRDLAQVFPKVRNSRGGLNVKV